MAVLIFGHKNPDTDAICSALAYADLLQRTTRPDAVAAACGPPNKRTEYVLKKAGVNAPKIVMDISPDVGDVCNKNPVTAREDDAFYEVYERMQKLDLSAIPVVDEQGLVVGILTLLDLLRVVMEGDVDPIRARKITSSVDKIREAVHGDYQTSVDTTDLREFMVMVGAMSAEGFTQRLRQYPPDQLLVVTGDRPTIQLPALEHGVRVMVVTGGYQLSPGVLQLAKACKATIITSSFDTATTTMRIKSSRIIKPAISRSPICLSSKMSVTLAREQVSKTQQSLFPVTDDTGKLIGVLAKSDLVNPPKPQLILVDHNELSQAVQGAEEAEILEVLDHHRIGGSLRTTQPIKFINDPVGSTCTLVARQFRAAGINPSKGIALCMASGIISDTLYLRSPTTTDVDRNILEWLSGFCGVDLGEYAKEFFAIGSSLRSCSPREVVREDCKEFEEQGHRFSISQIEEIGFDLFWNRKDELREALAVMARERRLQFSALFVTDIISNGSLLLMSSEPETWEEVNFPRVDVHLYQLDGVVSRKKQLLPLIAQLMGAAADSEKG